MVVVGWSSSSFLAPEIGTSHSTSAERGDQCVCVCVHVHVALMHNA